MPRTFRPRQTARYSYYPRFRSQSRYYPRRTESHAIGYSARFPRRYPQHYGRYAANRPMRRYPAQRVQRVKRVKRRVRIFRVDSNLTSLLSLFCNVGCSVPSEARVQRWQIPDGLGQRIQQPILEILAWIVCPVWQTDPETAARLAKWIRQETFQSLVESCKVWAAANDRVLFRNDYMWACTRKAALSIPSTHSCWHWTRQVWALSSPSWVRRKRNYCDPLGNSCLRSTFWRISKVKLRGIFCVEAKKQPQHCLLRLLLLLKHSACFDVSFCLHFYCFVI